MFSADISHAEKIGVVSSRLGQSGSIALANLIQPDTFLATSRVALEGNSESRGCLHTVRLSLFMCISDMRER